MDIDKLFSLQNAFFLSNETRSLRFRLNHLGQLKLAVQKAEKDILQALKLDLGKSELEAFSTELSVFYNEIDLCFSKLKSWSKVRRVPTNLINLPGASRIIPEPYGVCLIIGPWNYPFQLTFCPLVSALAAGNTAIIKPSELSPAVTRISGEIINSLFSPEYVRVVPGGAKTAARLCALPVHKIFFTGSTRVGKLVASAAAVNLTPVTLELGGKSPVIVASDANLPLAARRIAWGKTLNAGQTCIAPDYLLAHKSIVHELLEVLKSEFSRYIRSVPGSDQDYAKIVNYNHYRRILSLADRDKVIFGNFSNPDSLYISPTILYPVTFSHRCMQEEIFGPLLPVMEYENIDEIIHQIRKLSKPLALYVFSSTRSKAQYVLDHVSSGGAAVNDVIMHAANHHLPFGGVGQSGAGRYHGRAGFNEFSNLKSVLYKPSGFDVPLRYPPWTAWKRKLMSFFL
ncbi:aldehyde dehydrogenase family protein [Desulfonatronovibrio magnus]|uniref:aldehyde dehydrogenase family protein n=1 Tax=Desulfonatronovibrio magnus TaxID=698827 RepID=UPI0005EBD78B|nr:aldehyde dehydrogenase family protein [Desulfonatronovibrio magnus]